MIKEMEYQPLESVGAIRFGMKREDIRALLGIEYKEFKKTKLSKNTTDDFGFFHIFYTVDDKVDAVEIFPGVEIKMGDRVLFPSTIEEAENILGELTEEDDSFLQVEKSVGIYAPEGKIESILLGSKGYYE